MLNLDWMAWTWQTGVFFAAIATVLLLMTGFALLRPETPRRGVLGLATTRGDRLFLALLCAAFIHLAWLGLVGDDLRPASAIAILWAAALFGWA
jgi:predicted small integral membrane protein